MQAHDDRHGAGPTEGHPFALPIRRLDQIQDRPASRELGYALGNRHPPAEPAVGQREPGGDGQHVGHDAMHEEALALAA